METVPSFRSYLPSGLALPFSSVWNDAQNQLMHFQTAVEIANTKLFRHFHAILPDDLSAYWIRMWAKELLWKTTVASLEDIRSFQSFGFRLNKLLRLSATPSDEQRPFELEFTYSKDPIILDGKPCPFYEYKRYSSFRACTPIDFPGQVIEKEADSPRLILVAEEFLNWAKFLFQDDDLTSGQIEKLAHIVFSNRGEDDWCVSTHGEHYAPFIKRILDRLLGAIRDYSQEHASKPLVFSKDACFDDSLSEVLAWIVNEDLRLATRIMPGQNRPQQQVNPALAMATTASVKEYNRSYPFVFARDGDGYFIRAFGVEGHFQKLAGFQDLDKLLQSTGKPVSMFDLEGLNEAIANSQAGSRQHAIDKVGLDQLRAEINKYRHEIDDADDDVEKADSQLKYDELMRQFKLWTSIGGKQRDLNNIFDKLRPKFMGRLSRAYVALRSGQPPMEKLAEHFKSSIRYECPTFVYLPDTPPNWFFSLECDQ